MYRFPYWDLYKSTSSQYLYNLFVELAIYVIVLIYTLSPLSICFTSPSIPHLQLKIYYNNENLTLNFNEIYF
jgi:hypothetical protein